MESIYDMDIRFGLLEDRFKKLLSNQETRFMNQIKLLEELNLRLVKENINLEKKLEESNLELYKAINVQILNSENKFNQQFDNLTIQYKKIKKTTEDLKEVNDNLESKLLTQTKEINNSLNKEKEYAYVLTNEQ
jgi:hypothetical protein